MRVALLAKPGQPNTGVGRYVRMLRDGLQEAGVDTVAVTPALPPFPPAGYRLLRSRGVDLPAFFANYPLWAHHPEADIHHITSQNLASLLPFRRPRGRVVATVHDIIPYMLRDQPELCPYRTVADRLFDRLAMAGLRRADRLIADSLYTKRCVEEHLGIDPRKIAVVHLGIDRERFRPRPVPARLHERYGLPEGNRYLLYVGSEDPRKNLGTLLRALAIVRSELPDVALLKVGRAHFARERRRLLDLADELGIVPAVHFLDEVPEDDLPSLYNLADLCVMPSLYEGFGFPVLEAMACGTPVVALEAASLPELAGDAGLLVQPGAEATAGLARAAIQVLADPALSQRLRRAGLHRAAAFAWYRTTDATIAHYQDLTSQSHRAHAAT
jgi:glycosyltransferase involved in cell wall biosynthesis